MPLYKHPGLHRKDKTQIAFWFIYALSILFNFHSLMVAYSNSSYMEQFITPEVIGALYTIGSSLAVFGFLFVSRILRKIGNVRLTLMLGITEIVALLILASVSSPATLIVAFVIFITINPLLYVTIDIFSESLIGKNEGSTGSKRGLTLTLMSIAAVFAPLATGYIVGNTDANLAHTYYYAAGVFSLFILIVLLKFKPFEDPVYREIKVLEAIQKFWQELDVRYVFLAHFTLQIFFTWMVIYLPLYLATEINLPWSSIGMIIGVGLFAYVLIEYPVGVLADKYIGERELMAVGFVILAVSSSWITFMAYAPVVSWMILMFISRVGASLVEATTESYFFKHTKGGDANIISFFRLTRPLAMVIGSLLGSVSLLYLPFDLIFIVLALAMVPGIFFTMKLKDTK